MSSHIPSQLQQSTVTLRLFTVMPSLSRLTAVYSATELAVSWSTALTHVIGTGSRPCAMSLSISLSSDCSFCTFTF